jgi:glycosyltransferase involved in cell wall biosynthesis
LLVVSHVVHYHYEGRWFAYGAYTREIEVWADLFQNVTIAAPCQTGPPERDCLPFTRSNIALAPMHKTNGRNRREKLRQLFLVLPRLAWKLAQAMRHADAIQVRCPAHAGLLGALLAPVFSRRLVARYTGTWAGYPGEPWIWTLQRAVLRSSWWRGPVLIYGNWPNQPSHIIPIFNSVLTAREIERAKTSALRKRLSTPISVLFVGRLTASKNVDVLITALADLMAQGIPVQGYVVGDGPERHALETQARSLDIGKHLEFAGGVPLERVLDYYERCDVLVLASETEGWPKAIVEAMAFGLICIGSDRGLVPTILGDGRGLVVPPRDSAAIAASLRKIALSPQTYESMRKRSAAWAQEYSLDRLRETLRELLKTHWRTSITP